MTTTEPIVEDAYELSPTQHGMLFHAIGGSVPGVDVEQVAIELREPLSPELFVAAWHRVIDRHPILRTRFRWGGLDVPVQEVLNRVELPVATIDWSGLDATGRGERWEALADDDRVRVLDLEQAPVMRLTLVRHAEADWSALWTFHHALLDGRSFPLVLLEVFEFYDASRQGREPSPAQLPRPYGDYIAWLRGSDLAGAERHWRDALRGFRAPTPLVVAHEATAETQVRAPGGEAEIRLDHEATARLRRFAADHSLTLNTLVQGAWAILLHRYSGEEDVVFGATRACRRSAFADADSMIGLFINTLPLRVTVDPGARLLPWLQDLRGRQVALRPVEHTPLVKVHAWSEISRGRPLFESLVVYDNSSLDGSMRAAGFDPARGRFRYRGQTNFPVTVIAYGDEEMLLRLEHDRSRIDDEAAGRVLGHLATLLASMPSSAEELLGSLPLLTAAERTTLVLGGAAASFPEDVCLHGRFEEHAARHPDAIALTCDGQGLSYAELNRRANRLAHRLRELGVGPDRLVGLCVERSLDLVVGLLGILKSGGAYLPIDLAYPADRVAFMLDDAQASIVVTQRALVDRLPRAGMTAVLLDDALPTYPATNPDSGVAPDHLMYVIYTSGSTGQPKGALITHRNVARLMRATDAWYRFGPDDVWTLFHSIAFDFSVWEIWGALAYGGRVVVVPYWESRSPESFLQLLRDERVTVLNQTPSAFRQLILADLARGAPEPTALRYVIFGGEALELQSLRPWLERYGDAAPLLVNMYGITETCVHVTYRPIRNEDVEEGRGSVIGQPIPDLRVLVLDPRREPLPIGVAGEMYVGGAGLARGYLRRPELTSQRFVDDPFRVGERLYRTGDLARRLPNGELEYLGRIDHQVKIRGFRIELGEIESVLAQHPAVRECVVIAREDVPGDKRLVAYLAADGDRGALVDELRGFLKTKLPDYMVPAAFVFLDTLPLTPNGKVDRKALPAPDFARPESARRYEPPRSPAEEALASIWTAVLGVARVGIHDNFFELGGDSILAIQVITRARQAGIAITPRELFKRPTIAELADPASAVPAAPKASHDADTGEAPLTPIERWFFAKRFPDPAHWNQAFVFDVPEALDPAVLERALGELVRRHDALRFRFEPETDGWRRRVARETAAPRLDRHDVGGLDDRPRAEAIEAIAAALHRGLDLAHGPLLRAAHIRCGAGRAGRVVLVVHHLAVDGVSWRILLEDLEAAYLETAAGRAAELPAPATSFTSWARALSAFAADGAVRATLPYWLAREQQPTRLPSLAPHGTARHLESEAKVISVSLDAATTRALLQQVPAVYRTRIDDVLLAALAIAFREETGGGPLLVDLEGHGRDEIADDIDVSHTMGWFTTIYPVEISAPGGSDPVTVLKTTKEALRRVPHRGRSFGALRWMADDHDARRLAALPAAEIVFNYLGQLDATVQGSTLFRFSKERAGAWHAPAGERTHPVEILARVADGALTTEWTFSPTAHEEKTIARFAESFHGAIREIVALCLAPGAGGLTPSDVPAARVEQDELDRLPFPTGVVEDLYPLTPMQELFLSMETPGASAGFEGWRFRIDGPLDAAALEGAWRDCVARHPILRSAFLSRGLRRPHQVVLSGVELPWRTDDWRSSAPAAREARAAAFLREEAQRGFDLSTPPLMRLTLVRVEDAAWELFWSTHHLLIDGWSWPVVFDDLATFYDARRAGRPAALPSAPRFRDYVAWLASSRPDDEAYWRRCLDGVTEPTPVDLGGDRASGQRDQAGAVNATLDAGRTAALVALARDARTTLGVVVQAAWGLVLSHGAGDDDVVFGASFSGRPPELPGIGALVGPCVNNVPVRMRVEADLTLGAWLSRLQAESADRTPHQYASPREVQSWSAVPPRHRLFDSIVVVQNYRGGGTRARGSDGLAFRPIEVPEATAFALTLAVTPGTELDVKILFAPSRVAEADAAVWLEALASVLRAMADTGAAGGSVATLLARMAPSMRGRAALAAQDARRRASGPAAPPTTELEERIAAIWSDLFQREAVGVDRNFFDLGGHSLLLVQAHARLREALGREIPIVALLRYPTIRTLARHLVGEAGAGSTPGTAQTRARLQRDAAQRRKPINPKRS